MTTKNLPAAARRFGFAPLDDASGKYYCIHCLKVLATPTLTAMRAHHGSSFCAWRIAAGDAARDKERLGL